MTVHFPLPSDSLAEPPSPLRLLEVGQLSPESLVELLVTRQTWLTGTLSRRLTPVENAMVTEVGLIVVQGTEVSIPLKSSAGPEVADTIADLEKAVESLAVEAEKLRQRALAAGELLRQVVTDSNTRLGTGGDRG